jgi:hypothetical protein
MPDKTHDVFDAEIRAALLKHGDDGTVPRHTLFYFYGGNFTALGDAAALAGYRTRPTAKYDGVILETETAVDAASFAPHAAQMAKWTDEFGCDYDSWECQLVKR